MTHRSPLSSIRLLLAAASIAGAAVASPTMAASTAAEVDVLRQQFPVGSIASVPRADEALGATAGAKARVEKEYKATARDCMKTILVNDCLDRARLLQQKRLADIDAVELEANRYKRRDHADKLDADRAQREAERQAKAPADAEQREKNRKSFDDKQNQAARDVADRKKSADQRAKSPPRKPTPKPQAPNAPQVAAAQRAKNATEYASKVKEVAEHEDAIQRHLVSKAADRKRRADAKAVKDAAAARVAPAPVPAVAAPTALPSIAGPKS